MHLINLKYCLRYFSNEEDSQLASSLPLHLISEFPRNFCVSSVLVIFMLVLFCLAGEISFYLLDSASKDAQVFSTSSFLYLVAYLLANLLFVAHLALYFGYKEELRIEEDYMVLAQGFFGITRKQMIHRDQIFFYNTRQGALGGYHVEIYFFDERGKTRKAQCGSYLEDENIDLIHDQLTRMRY